LISKNSSNRGGWKNFSKENVGNVSNVLKRKLKRIKFELRSHGKFDAHYFASNLNDAKQIASH
jgi:hypothetical protein